MSALHWNPSKTTATYELIKYKFVAFLYLLFGNFIRGAVHAESERQTHIQERVCQDTRGMRGKARRADKEDESRNRSRKEKGENGIRKGATTNGRPSKFEAQ